MLKTKLTVPLGMLVQLMSGDSMAPSPEFFCGSWAASGKPMVIVKGGAAGPRAPAACPAGAWAAILVASTSIVITTGNNRRDRICFALQFIRCGLEARF